MPVINRHISDFEEIKDAKSLEYDRKTISSIGYEKCSFLGLYCSLFCNVVFENCIFTEAIFNDCQFYYCDFINCELGKSYMSHITFTDCCFEAVSFSHATITTSSFNGCDFFSKCAFNNADFYNTHMTNLNFRNHEADGDWFNKQLSLCTRHPVIPSGVPEEGSFIAYKKCASDIYGYCIVKLLVPEHAKRCSAGRVKGRVSEALVLSITNIDTGEEEKEARSLFRLADKGVTYKQGEIVVADRFDDRRFVECSGGIHIFLDKNEAINYVG